MKFSSNTSISAFTTFNSNTTITSNTLNFSKINSNTIWGAFLIFMRKSIRIWGVFEVFEVNASELNKLNYDNFRGALL